MEQLSPGVEERIASVAQWRTLEQRVAVSSDLVTKANNYFINLVKELLINPSLQINPNSLEMSRLHFRTALNLASDILRDEKDNDWTILQKRADAISG